MQLGGNCDQYSAPPTAETVTDLLEVFVRNEGESELGTTPDDTSRATFPERLEAFFSVLTANEASG